MKKRYWIPLLVLAILIAFRIALPTLVTDYVNRAIDDLEEYEGSIAGVDISLLGGYYGVDSLRIYQPDWEEEGGIPLMTVDRIDFSIDWGHLLQGSLVGNVEIISPELHFVGGPEPQTGAEVDWPQVLREMMPLHINRLLIRDGVVRYRDFHTEPEIDLPVSNLQVDIWNITNVERSDEELPTRLEVSGETIGGGKLDIGANLSLMHEIPHMDLDFSLEEVNLPELNDFLEAYAGVDAEEGTFSLYSEFAVEEGLMEGYVQPMVFDLRVLDLTDEDHDLFSAAWEIIVEGMTQVFQYHPDDQFATRVPFSGQVDDPEVGIFPSIWNIFRNAFIEAFQEETADEIIFGPADDEENDDNGE